MSDNYLTDKINKFLKDISSLDSLKREGAERILSTITNEEDLAELGKMAQKMDFEIKYYIVRHLSQFEYISVIDNLIDFLFDDSEIIQRFAQRGLEHINLDHKYDRFLELIESANYSVRLYAIKMLGRGEQMNAVLPLLKIITDKDPCIRYEVIDALRLIGDQRAEKAIINCLYDSEPMVRYAASFYCGSRIVKKASYRLLEMLQENNPKIRATCVWALGQIKNLQYISKLNKILLNEEDKNVRNEIMKVFTETGMGKFLEDNKKTLLKTNEPTRAVLNWTLANISKNKSFSNSDICLFVEGSYPYISGGVSSWVHELINYFSDMTFSIVHLVASRSEIKEFRYELPKNVLYYEDIYIYDFPEPKKRLYSRSKIHDKLDMLYYAVTSIDKITRDEFNNIFKELRILEDFQIDISDLLFSYEAWKFINRIYQEHLIHIPFLEYIWSYRSLVLPLYNIVTSRVPPASLYYSVLTGFAGLCAVFAKNYYNKPMMLTEHGIYHRERMIEINQAGWIYEVKQNTLVAREVFSGLKKVWIQEYFSISSLIYLYADVITTLFGENAKMQIDGGANSDKVVIIPNGIDMRRFEHIKPKILNKSMYTVALVGRVVSIKDIKTFIWAARLVCDKIPGKIKFLVLGPYNEEKDYADECFALTNLLGLEKDLKFTGNVDLGKAFNDIDLVVLTSISEGQPLSIMEAMSSGIPCVATNVGSCKELLYGKDMEDELLGKCGIITNVHSPNETANAIMEILGNHDRYGRMANVGKARINRYYQKKEVFERYRAEFNKLLHKS